MLLRISCLCLLSAMISTALAAPEPLESRMEVYRIEATPEGEEVAEPVEEAAPGETLEYRITYQNVSDQPLRSLVITGPIPNATNYVADSASTEVESDLVVSIDGGSRYEEEPVIRTRTLAEGTTEELVVGPERYTHVRWQSRGLLAPNETQVFRYRVKVE